MTHIKLNALQPPAIQRLYNEKFKNGLSAKTIRNLHGALHRALETAVKLGFIPKNPSSACTLPRVVEKDIQPLDTPDIARFLETLRGHRHEALFKVALFGGMRSGALLGLTWDCINFEQGTIYLCKQLTPPRKKGESYTLASVKNNKPRTITPAPYVMAVLKEHRHMQIERKFKVGDMWESGEFSNLVFTNDVGHNLTQCGVWKMLQKVLTEAGLPQHRFHDLRHTYAVNSLRAGDDVKTVQENLGHHTAAFTLDKYGHVTETMKRESALRMEAFIRGIEG